MVHKIKLIQSDTVSDISNICGNINLTTSVDTLGASFNFSVARNINDSNYVVTETIKNGDIIKFQNDSTSENIFTGIIIDTTTNRFSKDIKCLDFYFYLNNNKVIKQFNELNASACIEDLLKSIGAEIGTIENIATSIDKIYKNRTVAEIIEDILKIVNEETGKKYILEIDETTFSLVPHKKIKVEVENNIFGMPVLNESIINMKNVVLVVSNDQEEESIYAEVKDSEGIKKYGMLQEIIEVDPDKDDISKVRNIASQKLSELNRVNTKVTLPVLGNDELKAGRTLEIEIKEFDIKDEFLIKSCTHTFKKGHHICNLELEVS
ncbi:MAG: XkdQ/YqbQ family protein [Cetobacterium sp.]|uniref:XkdQ/YqbQ family protein n=1 Tax=Cetobacterium sp. TaxID=2071632 RepID=UPI003F302112